MLTSAAMLRVLFLAIIAMLSQSLLCGRFNLGCLPLNVGAAVKLPARKGTLPYRILTGADVVRNLMFENEKRNHALLRLLYAGGLRVSETPGLKSRDLVVCDPTAQVAIYGKGSRMRVVMLPVRGTFLASRQHMIHKKPCARVRSD